MAYFDNAATTYPKPECVYSFMDEFYRKDGANAGRGTYEKAVGAAKLISDTRVAVQQLLHCPTKQVIFEPTATISLNIIIQGIIAKGAKNIYISPFEHNAVTRTLYAYEKKEQIHVYQLSVSSQMQFELEKIRYQFEEIKPDMVIVSHVGNVFGIVAPVEEIFKIAKEFNAITLVDMAQSEGLVDINAGLETFDFAVFAGHKTMYGPTGIAGFVMKPSIDLPAVLYGGTGFESANQDMPEQLPQRFEFGTMNIAGIAGLYSALQWINTKGIKNIWEIEQKNREELLRIFRRYSFVQVVGNYDNNRYAGIVSVLLDGISSDVAGSIFNEQNISVRTGLECAPLAHKFAGTYPSGTIRFSVSYFSSSDDFSVLSGALDNIADLNY